MFLRWVCFEIVHYSPCNATYFVSKTRLVYGQMTSDRTHETHSHWVQPSQVLSPSQPPSTEQTLSAALGNCSLSFALTHGLLVYYLFVWVSF